ncbi:MFS transporter [Thiofilum flexile]|uniref:MFS transporter n=1 Tax=Thiofilum flexile TaxID=125627 RepID=UPI000374B6F6|nr:MFS transporter [Thiofilum flexile]
MNRSLALLTLAQASYWSAVLIGVSLSPLIGAQLTPIEGLATLPYTLVSLSALICTYSFSQLVQHTGWRAGFRLGAAAGLLAALVSVWAIALGNFYLFCAASILMGLYQASAAFYRLAALDSVPATRKGSAVGWVLSGSLIAALLGPTLAIYAGQWLPNILYAGPYLLAAGFGLLALLLISALPVIPRAAPQPASSNEQKGFLRRTSYWQGTINTAFGQFAMLLMMIVAPLSMHQHQHYPTSIGLSVIGWHLIGMFLPSFVSGKLLDKFSAPTMIYTGFGVLAGSALIALAGTTTLHYYLSLFLLGIGWNFLYVAGTWQYNSQLEAAEKGRAQGLTELLIALATALGAALGGVLLSLADWQNLNGGLLVTLIVMVVLNLRFPAAALRLSRS